MMEMSNIKLNCVDGPFGDETCNYEVEMPSKTVGDFVDTVLKERKNEWGEVCIRSNKGYEYDACLCSYKKGSIERAATNYDEYAKLHVKDVKANGGWGKMSYDVFVDETDAPKQRREEFQFVYFGWN